MQIIPIRTLAQRVGQEIGTSEWFRVDQDLVNRFAEATGDFQWIHVDVERATRELGAPIAHGYLMLSLLPRLSQQISRLDPVAHALNYGLNRVRFTSPVSVGSRVRLRQTLASVVEKGDGLLVTYAYVMELEGGVRPVLVAEALVLVHPATTPA